MLRPVSRGKLLSGFITARKAGRCLVLFCLAGLALVLSPILLADQPAPNILLTAVDDKGHDTPTSFGSQAEPVLSMDFESVPPGGGAEYLLQHGKLTLAPGAGVAGSTGLRAEYTGYDRGSERIVKHVVLPEPGLEFSLNYDVEFEQDFQFVRGGKLLGLGPKKHITGGRSIVPEGWSARVMFKEEGGIKLYSYHQDMKGQYGERGDIQQPFRFEKERVYSVSLHVRVNDPATASNGFSRLYVDGVLIEQHENMRLRGTEGDDTRINKFMFSSFHGGHEPDWAPRDEHGNYMTVHAIFDSISVYEGEHIRRQSGGKLPQ